MGSHSFTCHPTEVIFTPLPQPKLVLDLATPEGCKAELPLVVEAPVKLRSLPSPLNPALDQLMRQVQERLEWRQIVHSAANRRTD